MFKNDDGYIDITNNLISGESYILNAMIDRLWLDYTSGEIQVKLGRQRINWGQTFVWNPNDIFNAYSFFDIDYPERPGSDALRIQYYTGMTSSIEGAIKVDSAESITAAALWRFSKWDYDIQLLGGIYNENDYVVGAGWSGYIKGASFRGEISYFHPKNNYEDTTGLFSVALSSDYTFSNSLNIQIEALYNELPNKGGISSFSDFYNLSLSAKQLSFTEFNYFGQASYPITPLLTGGIAGIYYPEFKGFYLGPNLEYSLKENLYLSTYLQTFSGKFEIPDITGQIHKKRISYNLLFIKLKWNF